MAHAKILFWETNYQMMNFYCTSTISDQFILPGYEIFTNPSRKHHDKKNGRPSGGIALGFKTALKQGVKSISTHENFIWAKLDKHFSI